jgi:hypothetical protein
MIIVLNYSSYAKGICLDPLTLNFKGFRIFHFVCMEYFEGYIFLNQCSIIVLGKILLTNYEVIVALY